MYRTLSGRLLFVCHSGNGEDLVEQGTSLRFKMKDIKTLSKEMTFSKRIEKLRRQETSVSCVI